MQYIDIWYLKKGEAVTLKYFVKVCNLMANALLFIIF